MQMPSSLNIVVYYILYEEESKRSLVETAGLEGRSLGGAAPHPRASFCLVPTLLGGGGRRNQITKLPLFLPLSLPALVYYY